VEPVQAAGALRPIGHETRLLQQAQVARHRGTADRELVGQLTHRPIARAEQLDDRPAVRVAEGIEGVSGKCFEGHLSIVTG